MLNKMYIEEVTNMKKANLPEDKKLYECDCGCSVQEGGGQFPLSNAMLGCCVLDIWGMTWKTTATLLLLVPVLQAPLARYAARERVYPFCYWNALKSPAAKIFPAGGYIPMHSRNSSRNFI